ncbi:MAG TPA: hypothetical protein VLC51_06320 [Nitrospira sp.]|nr:hypothetical protein [Nitrospira sp.]
MPSGVIEDVRPILSDISLLPKNRTILEREFMEFRPFGVDEQGAKIRDLTGMSIRATAWNRPWRAGMARPPGCRRCMNSARC